ncbi:hypothetical protein D3C87_1606990 [compost metagenome]
MVVVAASGDKDGLGAVAGRDFEAQQATIEIDGAVQVGHFEVHVTYLCLGGYDIVICFHWRCNRFGITINLHGFAVKNSGKRLYS